MRKAAWGAVWAGLALAGCAGSRATAPVKPEVEAIEAKAVRVDPKLAAKDRGSNFVDRENGFVISRPGTAWAFRPGEDLSTESIVVPVVLSNAGSGAQVVVQIAPAVATPAQFAERLTTGLQTRAGFSTGEAQPIPLADGAVGFDFEVGGQVRGRVAIVEGTAGRIYVLLATWPRGSPDEVEHEVDRILGSLRTTE